MNKCSRCKRGKRREELIPASTLIDNWLLCTDCYSEFTRIHNDYEIQKNIAFVKWINCKVKMDDRNSFISCRTCD